MPLWVAVSFTRELHDEIAKEKKSVRFQDILGPFKDDVEVDEAIKKIQDGASQYEMSYGGCNYSFVTFEAPSVQQRKVEKINKYDGPTYRIKASRGP
jgi:hypothetical protein